MFVDTVKRYTPASSCLSGHNLNLLRTGNNDDRSEHYRSTEYFHGIPADPNIGNAIAFPGRAYVHFARTPALSALANQYLLITTCNAVLDHPAGRASRRGSRGWVLATVEEHSSGGLKLGSAPVGTEEIKKVR